MEGLFRPTIKLTGNYHLPQRHAVPPTAAQVSRRPQQPIQPEGDDTGDHINHTQQLYRSIPPCPDIEMICFLHNFSHFVLFIDTKFF